MRVLTVRSKKLFFVVCMIVHCLKIIGLAPFSVPIGKPAQINPQNSRVQAFFVSKLGRAYNILLSILVTVGSVLDLQGFINGMKTYTDGMPIGNIVSAIWTVNRILYSFTSSTIMISWAFGQRNAASIMNRLLEVDFRLSGLKKRPFNKRALIFLFIHIIINACLWITYWIWLDLYFDAKASIEFLIRIPEDIVYWFMMEYVTIVGLLSRDLRTVNTYLLDFKEFGDYLFRPRVCNGRVLPVVTEPIHAGSQIASLQLLRSVRMTLSELCGDVADFFSLPILLCIACCFVSMFKLLYSTTQLATALPPGFTACYTMIFVLKNVYPVVSLTLNVTRTMKEAKVTGRIVHKLLVDARTENIKAELEQFSLQLLHEKVNFTAYGLFTLDSTLLHSMLGGAAGYAIILIQFQSSVCYGNGGGNGTSAAE